MSTIATQPAARLALIAQARREVIDNAALHSARVEGWISRSWQRCLAHGHRPQQRVGFDAVSAQAMRRVAEQNRVLVATARPVMAQLARAMAGTCYFALLTDAQGVVVDVGDLPSGTARRSLALARVGVDLSERAVGTTAIGAALAERQPVWLHRGEHFFDDTSIYTCAGAPLFGPMGDCIGMLDLTGVEVAERPELRHLAALSARRIENALLLQQPHALLLRLNWPGHGSGEATDGLLCLDEDGLVTGANAAARQMLNQPMLPEPALPGRLHAGDLFALPFSMLWDAARHGTDAAIEIPLWSGLRLVAWPRRGQDGARPALTATPPQPRLRELEATLIRRAVDEALGNVAEAARALGISRATVYRKLRPRQRER